MSQRIFIIRIIMTSCSIHHKFTSIYLIVSNISMVMCCMYVHITVTLCTRVIKMHKAGIDDLWWMAMINWVVSMIAVFNNTWLTMLKYIISARENINKQNTGMYDRMAKCFTILHFIHLYIYCYWIIVIKKSW